LIETGISAGKDSAIAALGACRRTGPAPSTRGWLGEQLVELAERLVQHFLQ
jgi:hypothetical protein